LRRDWPRDAGVRFAAGSALLLGFFTLFVALWEFGFGGALLETPYYFSGFNLGIGAALASVFFLLFGADRAPVSRGLGTILAAAAIIGAAIPTIAIYRLDWWRIGLPGARVTIACMVAALILVIAAAFLSRRARLIAACAAILLIPFSANYAAASGGFTHTIFSNAFSYQSRRDTLLLGTRLISFMKQNGFQDERPPVAGTSLYPEFWYDIDENTAFNAMNSVYLWAYTWAGIHLPQIDQAMRSNLEARRPSVLVLLCSTPACRGARDALMRAGYANRPIVAKNLVAGDAHAWAVAVRLLKFAKPPAQ
jgi:hypothetical protein